MRGFTIRFKSKEEFIKTINLLKYNGFLGSRISIGTSIENDISVDDIFVKEEYKSIHIVEDFPRGKKKVSDDEFVTLSLINRSYDEDEFITGLSVGASTDFQKENYSNQLGDNPNISFGFSTSYDDKVGDIYDYLVYPKDVFTEVEKLDSFGEKV
jgi:hypothetical protein